MTPLAWLMLALASAAGNAIGVVLALAWVDRRARAGRDPLPSLSELTGGRIAMHAPPRDEDAAAEDDDGPPAFKA